MELISSQKGRIPSAVGKPAKEVQEHEKTLYYERMAFAMEIPSINDRITDNSLNLTIGGVRVYNLTNLHLIFEIQYQIIR